MESDKFKARFERKRTQPNLYPVLGWICVVVSLLFFPLLIGAAGVVFGYLTKKSGKDVQGVTIMALSVACGLIGTLIGFIAPIH
ncbi:hypothetical protein ASL14_09420 [Paenibacillus sp. IHB B 3084]|uniref:hypothetical protein n=1 Tax=Paenibacillus sp. IHB B 3084 TaxID=867076 RepID=UPI000721F477|nr:hypothetical protein [Paenibacillus sp. IHB B 3084]ALP36357.1 hypothetical protein ASL14_09420 [Paenibacillus sp. IHB B 3084]